MAGLVTSDDLASFLQQDVELDEGDRAAAEFAVLAASGVVRRYCRRAFSIGAVPDEVRLATLRIAARMYKNPQGQSAYSYDGVAAGIPVDMSGRIITPDERLLLDHFRRKMMSVGMVLFDPPDTDEVDPDAYPASD